MKFIEWREYISSVFIKVKEDQHLVAFAVCYPLNTFIQKISGTKIHFPPGASFEGGAGGVVAPKEKEKKKKRKKKDRKKIEKREKKKKKKEGNY